MWIRWGCRGEERMSVGKWYTKQEKKYILNHITEDPKKIVFGFNSMFPSRPTKGLLNVIKRFRSTPPKKKILSVKIETQNGVRDHTRMTFTPDQIVVLSEDKPHSKILVEFSKRFPEEDIPSLNTFTTWIRNARKINEHNQKEKMKVVEKSLNKHLNEKEIKPSPSFVDDEIVVKNHNLLAEHSQLMKEMITAINSIVPSFVAAIESSKKKE